jgi:hypothetical protein
MRHCNHQTEIGDMTAGGMLVTRKRQPPDDPTVLQLRNEDRCVRVAANRTEVPTLVAD